MTTNRFRLLARVLGALGMSVSLVRAGEPIPQYQRLPPPKVLYLADSSNRESFAEKLRAKLPAQVTFVPVFYEGDAWQLADKPLEQTTEQIAAVTRAGGSYRDAALAHLNQYDVIIMQFPASSADTNVNHVVRDIETRLAQRVREGGKLVIIDHPASGFAGTPLAEILPCKATANTTWTTSCEGATDHPFSRGLPFEVTGSHTWGTLYEAFDPSSIPLTRNQSNRIWLRTLPGGGKTVYLYEVYGQTYSWSSSGSSKTYDPERPDEGAVWDALLPRLIYGLVYGDRAFPVLAKLEFSAGSRCQAGGKLTVPVDVENRSGEDRQVTVEIEIGDRRSPNKITGSQPLALKKGVRQTIAFEKPVTLPGTDNYLQVRARVLDEAGKTWLSESTAWIPYVPQVPLTLELAKPGYRPGERITATINHGTNALPGDSAVRLYLVDHEGRALQSCEATKSLSMPDGGPKFLSSYWVTAVVESPRGILGTARAQVQVDQPWTMRNQMQWSVWTNTGDPRTLALFRDAGMNALGCEGNTPAADRFGLRQYTEGTDFNTFGVTIDYDNWKDLRVSMDTIAADRERAGTYISRSTVLVSLGEESGFKNGWGQRYYWEGDKAPAIPQKVFDDYLAERYGGDIALLNHEWGTEHKSFAEILLEKAKVKAPEQAFVNAQAWEAGGKPKGSFPIELKQVDPAQKYLAKTAPCYETYSFFDWYYEKYCDLAMDVYRTKRDPVPLSIMSAPGGFYPKVDVYGFGGIGPFYSKDYALVLNAIARRDYGDQPGFGLLWAHYNLRSLWSASVLSSLLVGNTHIDYWVDFPLNFNPDLTHTRASLWTKVLTDQTRLINPILLQRRFAYTKGLGLFVAKQPAWKGITGEQFGGGISPNTGVYAALEDSGYLPKVVQTRDLKDISVLIACQAQLVSPDEGQQLTAFVRRGGLLIVTPWLASCSPHGNLLSVYPAPETGLADLLGFQLVNTSQPVQREEVPYQHLPLLSRGHDRVVEIAADVQVLGRYADGTPLVLKRQVGRGHVVYLNLIHDFSAWWTLNEPSREAYRQLLDSIIRPDGRVRPEYFISFQSAEYVEDNKGWGLPLNMDKLPPPGAATPWWSSQLFSDPTGRIKYLATFSDHRSPKVTAEVQWSEPDAVAFDLFTGNKVVLKNGRASLTLRPGEAAFWGITHTAPKKLNLEMSKRVVAGTALKLKLASPHAAGVVLDVYDSAGKRSRDLSLASVQLVGGQATVEIPTAYNDPPGEYRVVATESMTRLRTERSFTLTPATRSMPLEILTPFPRRVSEDWPVATMTASEFLGQLRLLRAIYTGTHQGLEAKYMLSYFLNVPFRENNRHAILRRLQRVDWTPHLNAVADAIRSGEKFYLLGEDLNRDPESGLTIDPFAVGDPTGFLAQLAKLPDAKQQTRTVDGFTLAVIDLGKGTLVACPTASVDRTAYLSSDFAAWHAKLKAALNK